MWTTDTRCVHEHNFDKVVEMTHDFGNKVTVVSNLEKKITTLMYGGIVVDTHDLIRDPDRYTNYLNELNNEVNPLKD